MIDGLWWQCQRVPCALPLPAPGMKQDQALKALGCARCFPVLLLSLLLLFWPSLRSQLLVLACRRLVPGCMGCQGMGAGLRRGV